MASETASQRALVQASQQVSVLALVLKALVRASADPVGLALLAVRASPPLLADL
jgi:hypothetical protein